MVGMTLTGTAQLSASLSALPEALRRDVLLEALKRAGEPMRARMRTLAPHGPDAPHLADHIVMSAVRRVEGVPLHEQEAAIAVGPSKDFFYGLFWEYGWTHHPAAHPFARPAYDSEVDGALMVLGRELWGAIQRAASTRSFSGGSL